MSKPKKSEPVKGGQTTAERLWAHRIADAKIAAERALGAGRR